MVTLQTWVEVPNPSLSINYADKVLFLGSCFSTNIGQRLKRLKFPVNVNPFGVLYNPASISQAIKILTEQKSFREEELDKHNDLWFSFYFHSSFSHSDKLTCLSKINTSLEASAGELKQLKYVFITLGTAWAYRYKKTGNIVSNCHKIPAGEFIREYMGPEKVVQELSESMKLMLKNNKDVRFVITVSPIRHWKDGAIENMRSKSSLLLAIKELEETFSNVYYFPVYEIYMDELRDYRFYASDMLHPSEFSIDYVWERFAETFFSGETMRLAARVDKLIKSFQHRPLNAGGEPYKKFLLNLKENAAKLEAQYPFLEFTEELKAVGI